MIRPKNGSEASERETLKPNWRMAVTCITTLALGSGLASAQEAYSKAIENVKSSVAQIVLNVKNPGDATSPKMPPDLAPAFQEGGGWIAGTGFLINDDGDILTAAHVVIDMGKVADRLSALGIETRPWVAFVAANVDGPAQDRRDRSVLEASVKFVDPQFDIAVLHPGINPRGLQTTFGGTINLDHPKAVRFDVTKPKAGLDIFVCGFPYGSYDAVNTSGNIASS